MDMLNDNLFEELWFGEDDPAHADRAACDSLSASVAKVTGLKPMPVVAQKLLAQLNAPEWDGVRVASTMERDPSMAAMVLRLANSSFYLRGLPTSSVRQAVTRLGGSKLRELVVCAAVINLIQGRSTLATDWRDHCAATAAVAKVLAGQTQGVDPAIAFLSGLLHDMGKLLLLETKELDYSTISAATDRCDEALPAAERLQLDFDHAVLGGHVMKVWGIPDPIPQIVAWHHQPARAYQADRFTADHVAILRVADRIAEHLDAGEEVDVDGIAQSPDAEWVGLSAQDLSSRLDRYTAARAEALSVFVSGN